MAHDPVADAALSPLRDLLQRYLQVVDVLNSAVDALAQQLDPGSEPTGRPRQSTPEPNPGDPSIEKREEMQTILAFQERLSEVLGVASVTLEGSSDSGFRFLVEMDNPPY
jgi:hypothetical protein